MVADQLDALLGEHLMPLRVRNGTADEPHLLAVDASGQPVVVEIVAFLDEEAALSALRHAGRAARMSTRDLARAYSGGAERYPSHLAAFRLTVPSTALLSTTVRGGARLLLVCSHISPGMEDVLEFLLQPGWQVDVLRAEVVTDSDGNRVVELSPVARSSAPDRGISGDEWTERDSFVRAPQEPEQVYHAPAEPQQFEATPLYRAQTDEQPTVAATTGWGSGRGAAQPSWSSASPASDWETPAAIDQSTWETAPRPEPVIIAPSFAVTTPHAEVSDNDPLLAAVAETLGDDVVLIWCPEGASECHEALLYTDGTIEFANGSQFGDVEEATRALADYDESLDPWELWHVDSPTGPTLAELAESLYVN